MDDFATESSIAGARVFHTSESKKIRFIWLFINFVAFILVGFYAFNIFIRCKLEPEFSYEFSKIPIQEIPFPAVTICSPLFASNQSINIQEFLQKPNHNLSFEHQNYFAANIQACDPHLGHSLKEFFPLAETEKSVHYLELKFSKIFRSKQRCSYNWRRTKCSVMSNYVLTDFGFCYSFNLEGFPTLFNSEVISDDFKCYMRDGKISTNYYSFHEGFKKKIYEKNQSIDWTLETGYLTTKRATLPVRSIFEMSFGFDGRINASDFSNLCPKFGKRFLFFFHMPNEILTPFHKPHFANETCEYILKTKLYKIDESLRPYPPEKRNCFFDNERKLKFFKSYTKSLCEFECLTNFTLDRCGCVKFSMPRENSTRICGLNETSCYIQVAKNWNLTCNCLQSCTYIEYEVKQNVLFVRKYPISFLKVFIKYYFGDILGEKVKIFGAYDIYQGFADFGGMLGTIFGASLLSIVELLYFLSLSFARKKFKFQDRKKSTEISYFVSSSTIHGVLFIFDRSRHKIIRCFWTIAFVLASICCIINSRESYLKLNVVPETESTENIKPIDTIPFPAITICSPLFAKGNLTTNTGRFILNWNENQKFIKKLSLDQFYYMIVNYYWASINMPDQIMKARTKFVENINHDFKKRKEFRYKADFFVYLNRSHLEVDELFTNCKLKEVSVKCSKIFRRVMTIHGICYVFNMQTHRLIFNSEISKNFDSYGRFEEYQESQWSLDQGYINQSINLYPIRALKENTLELTLIITEKDMQNLNGKSVNFYFNLPNEPLTHFSSFDMLYHYTQKIVKLSAKSKRVEEKLRKFLPENRGCYFQNERKLQFFTSYTRTNCMLECFTNTTLERCNCVAFLLPHFNSTILCDSENGTSCYDRQQKHFPHTSTVTPCDCLPTCNDIDYSWQNEEVQLNSTSNKVITSHIKFQVSNSKMLEEEISVAFGFRDFLTNVGGLLGLYIGCSFVSVFEVFYFLYMLLISKLAKCNNRVVPVEKNIQNRERFFVLEDPQKYLGKNQGLTLLEIFDIEFQI